MRLIYGISSSRGAYYLMSLYRARVLRASLGELLPNGLVALWIFMKPFSKQSIALRNFHADNLLPYWSRGLGFRRKVRQFKFNPKATPGWRLP